MAIPMVFLLLRPLARVQAAKSEKRLISPPDFQKCRNFVIMTACFPNGIKEVPVPISGEDKSAEPLSSGGCKTEILNSNESSWASPMPRPAGTQYESRPGARPSGTMVSTHNVRLCG